ncbi:Predicted protein [Taphrina deformans PYCC 5710]|uniref:RRM domain-containing protein n=1 Tax=Taphrina deformans (strain PYCC 5710 / ATCC 11124 / CBS 356.35 / IMI 108563 / JCM 9778 / NBRC 8474) TaxID=1097556 RepID=R4X8T5_TAPDE|nr:Predicted protein [Taphrina deformans PYCC 5710]|eukprot:CCG81830.1 Predicted protein [Taphrina deformans PYCC 5710]
MSLELETVQTLEDLLETDQGLQSRSEDARGPGHLDAHSLLDLGLRAREESADDQGVPGVSRTEDTMVAIEVPIVTGGTIDRLEEVVKVVESTSAISPGEVLHADVLMNSDGRSKGCGVVEYATASEAQRAISELSNQTLSGRMVYIREDREQDKGFGNSRGGFGGGSRGAYQGSVGGGYQDRPYQSHVGVGTGQITQPQLYVTNLPYSVGWQDLKDLFRNAGHIIRADVQIGFDGRSKGTGTVLFDSTADAQNAYKQFQGYDWQGRMLDIREDRFASGRGGMRGGFSDRGGFSGRGGRGGYSSGGGYSDRGYGGSEGGYDSYRAPAPVVVDPNPFTDNAWPNGEPSATIYVKNLPWSTSNDDLVELFSTIGKVERAEICYEPSGRSKGTGVVEFDGQESAAISIQKFTGYSYGGRPLGLTYVRYGDDGASAGPAIMQDPSQFLPPQNYGVDQEMDNAPIQ